MPRTRHAAAVTLALATILATILSGVLASPSLAACHIAAFTTPSVTVSEADGSVELTIFLQGRQPGCAGTVDYATQDGTAVAGEDYEATSGTVTFVAEDDREETITIELLEDDVVEDDETFQVALSNPQGLGGTAGPATVTITDAAVESEPSEAPSEAPSPSAAATVDGGDPATTPLTSADDDGGLPWLAIVAAVLITAGAAFGLRRFLGQR